MPSPPPPPETAGKSKKILEQAIRTFAEMGFRGTDVQLIADRAGVGKGTVYRHFGAKEDLFWTAAFEVFTRLQQTLVAAEQTATGAAAKLHASCLAYAQFFEQYPEYLEVFVQDRAEFRGTGPDTYKREHKQLLLHFRGIVERGVATGELRPCDPNKTMIALSGLLYGVTVQGCYLLDTLSMREVIEQGVDVFLAGIRGEGPLPAVETSEEPSRDVPAPPPPPT